MDGLDIFYSEDTNDFSTKVKVYSSAHESSRLFYAELSATNHQYVIDLTKRRFKQLNDYTVFPVCYDIALYNYIVIELAKMSKETLVFIKSRFICG